MINLLSKLVLSDLYEYVLDKVSYLLVDIVYLFE